MSIQTNTKTEGVLIYDTIANIVSLHRRGLIASFVTQLELEHEHEYWDLLDAMCIQIETETPERI